MKDKKITDLSYLERISDGDQDFKIDMIDTFLDTSSTYIFEMKASLEINNWKKIGDIAHSLKPSFTLMGMDENKKLIQEIEFAGRKADNIQLIPVLIDQLEKIISKAHQELLIEKEKMK